MEREHGTEHEELRMEVRRLRDRLVEAEKALVDLMRRINRADDQAGASTETAPD